MQKEEQNSLYRVVESGVSEHTLKRRNQARAWEAGYNAEHDFVVISHDGTIGDVVEIQGLRIALPAQPDKIYARSKAHTSQYWERFEYPKELARIRQVSQWNAMNEAFKDKWVDYIEEEFERREKGFWFMNNGVPTYITGTNYMYLQWSRIDVGYADYREANRIFFLFWEACKVDERSFGMCYLKIRRSGFSFMASNESVNVATLARDARIGILSKTGGDAKKMFTDKVVPINSNYPFFFKPVQDGMDKPKTELAYRVPAAKITKKNMNDVADDDIDGLDTTIDWKSTGDNSYDGEKLLLLVQDEAGKWEKPDNILNNWRVTKTCLRLGGRVVGKCMMGSTCNALAKGGDNFKKLYDDSNLNTRGANGQTKSGLYALFIPMEHNFEGYIDRYGMPVLRTPPKPVEGVDGVKVKIGAIDYWENEVESLKSDPDALNEFYRQFPRTESHAFRDESKQSLFNLTKIYQQIDYNDNVMSSQHITRGSFHWRDGKKDSEVIWTPDPRGRFLLSWIPNERLRNNVIKRGDLFYPGNEHIGAFGCDSYDISGVVGGGGSNGALHGLTKFNMDDAPSNEFFLQYIARPSTAEIFYEEVLMACVFYGMPVLAENNKPRLLYHFKNRGYRKFSLNRPDRPSSRLSKTEKELGGIPNSSEEVKQAHASAIESYIEKYIGVDLEGTYRSPEEIGIMPFNRTLEDWAKFDINNRTRFDATISSGLAIMATQKHMYQPEKKKSTISLNFARYNNSGAHSELVK